MSKTPEAYLTAINLSASDVWPETLKLIDRYRELIELVADALIRSGELDGAQFNDSSTQEDSAAHEPTELNPRDLVRCSQPVGLAHRETQAR
jgi:hypothetical protein